VRASNGIVTLSGDVGSDAERVADAQDVVHTGGIQALVNSLRVITYPTKALQRSSASVVPTVRESAIQVHQLKPLVPACQLIPRLHPPPIRRSRA
jgi:hypothetical protein